LILANVFVKRSTVRHRLCRGVSISRQLWQATWCYVEATNQSRSRSHRPTTNCAADAEWLIIDPLPIHEWSSRPVNWFGWLAGFLAILASSSSSSTHTWLTDCLTDWLIECAGGRLSTSMSTSAVALCSIDVVIKCGRRRFACIICMQLYSIFHSLSLSLRD